MSVSGRVVKMWGMTRRVQGSQEESREVQMAHDGLCKDAGNQIFKD